MRDMGGRHRIVQILEPVAWATDAEKRHRIFQGQGLAGGVEKFSIMARFLLHRLYLSSFCRSRLFRGGPEKAGFFCALSLYRAWDATFGDVSIAWKYAGLPFRRSTARSSLYQSQGGAGFGS